jgi:hypothetical protein
MFGKDVKRLFLAFFFQPVSLVNMIHENNPLVCCTGKSNFKFFRGGNRFFIDKSLFIKDFVNSEGYQVILRPRRFGKTLNLSMLSYFFSYRSDMTESESLFSGLKIMEDRSFCAKHFGKYSVVYLDLKDCVAGTKEEILDKIRMTFTTMIEPFWNIVGEALKQLYMSDADNHSSFIHSIPDHKLDTILGTLSSYLQKLTGRYSIILIDEYDAPLNVQFASDDDRKATETFFSRMYSRALKNNNELFSACLAGVAEIRGSGILSGLNNLRVRSLNNVRFSSFFGFTEREVLDVLINQRGMTEEDAITQWSEKDGIKEWYNGYHIGDSLLVNPWSFACYIEDMEKQNYWVKTSSTEALFNMCWENPLFGESVAQSFPILLSKPKKTNESYCSIPVSEFTSDLAVVTQQSWDRMKVLHFLCMTGYLTYRNREPPKDDQRDLVGEVSIPNKELFMEWNKLLLKMAGVTTFNQLLGFYKKHIEALEGFDCQSIANLINEAMSDLNKRECKYEYMFHMFLAGMWAALNSLPGWSVTNESGAGEGFADLIIENSNQKLSLIFEFKKSNSLDKSTHEKLALRALDQIHRQRYYKSVNAEHKVLAIGVVFISNSQSRVPTILLRAVELATGNTNARAEQLNAAISSGNPTIYVPISSEVATLTTKRRKM